VAIETKSKGIDGVAVRVQQLPAVYANRLLTRVLKYFGSGIIQLLSQLRSISSLPEVKDGKVSIIDLDLDWKEISAVVNDFASKLAPEDWQDFCLQLLAFTDVNGKRITDEDAFNGAFTGKLLFMVKVLIFTMEVNYGDFFGVSGISAAPKPPVLTSLKSEKS